MINLSIIPLIFLQWFITSEWQQISAEGWSLNASSPGTYSISGCTNEITENATIKFNWKQDLSGSNNNYSQVFFVLHTPNSAFVDTIFIRAGENGSDDPLRIYSTTNIIAEVHHELFDFSSLFDLDFTLQCSSGNSLFTLSAGDVNSGWEVPLCDFSFPFNNLECMGFSATCTSSQTTSFTFSLYSLNPSIPPTTTLSIISHEVISPSCVNIIFNRLPPDLIATWRANTPLESLASVTTFHHRATICGLPPLTDGYHHQIQIISPEIDSTLIAVYTDPNSAEYHDLVVTEIMADGTPSQGFPEDEFIEITNLTDRIIDISGWSILDGGGDSEIVPESYWNGMVSPLEAILICRDIDLWSEYSGHKARLVSWSGLNDQGELVRLLKPDGTLIDEVEYERNWWDFAGVNHQAGRSISKIFPNGCSSRTNWNLSNTASPFFIESVAEVISEIETTLIPHLKWGNKIELNITPEIDPHFPPRGRLVTDLNWDELVYESGKWFLYKLIPLDIPSTLELEALKNCLTGELSSAVIENWMPALPPTKGDLVICEIRAVPVSGEDEWVELVNNSDRSIDLDGVLFQGEILHNISLDSKERVVISEQDLENWTALASTSGQITISVESDVIDQVNYKKCWHDSRESFLGGNSIEKIFEPGSSNNAANWSSGGGLWGDSRGIAPVIAAEEIIPSDTYVMWGISEGRLSWSSSSAMDSCVLKGENWNINSNWSFLDASLTMAIAENVWDGEIEISCSKWKAIKLEVEDRAWILNPPKELIDIDSKLILNEFLSKPHIGYSSFIEIHNPSDQTISINGYKLTTTLNPQGVDWEALSDINWWLPSERYMVLSECPN